MRQTALSRGRIARKRIRWPAFLLLGAFVQAGLARADAKEPTAISADTPAEFKTNRPITTPQRIVLTVGQGEGDLQGNDDKVLQAAVDYVFRLGGGTVRILPGAYTMRNALFLRSGITLRGSGADTILKKAPSVSSPLIREADSSEYCVQVADPKGFTPGCGVAVSNNKWEDYPPIRLCTVTAVRENVLYLDQRLGKDFWMQDEAKVQTLFSILHGVNADDVQVEEIVLDGNRGANDYLSGNFGAAAFLLYSNRWTFRNVVAQDYNGDGFSVSASDDVLCENCQGLNNARFGFHSGLGGLRSIFKNCTAKGNREGIYWCWAACDGLAENCTLSENAKCGTNFSHRDAGNLVRNCTIERNGEAGVIFSKEENEFRTPDRNRIEGCLIRDNGGAVGFGVDIQWKTRDIAIANCRFENSPGGKQNVAVRISREAEQITLEGNTFTHCPVEVQDLRVTPAK